MAGCELSGGMAHMLVRKVALCVALKALKDLHVFSQWLFFANFSIIRIGLLLVMELDTMLLG